MGNLGMKLHTIDPAALVLHRVQRVVGQRCHMEAFWNLRHVITMTHPNVHLSRQTLKEPACDVENFQPRITKLSIRRSDDITAKLTCEYLKAITDSE